MKRKSRAGLISAGALLITAIAVSGFANGTAERTPASLVAKASIAEINYETEVAAFLASHPEPQSADFDHSVEGQNSYWRAMVAWWNAVPWDAVAGQWGCTSQAAAAAFNPPDERGVITAGYGGTGNCVGANSGDNPAVFSIPKTRSTVINENPQDFD